MRSMETCWTGCLHPPRQPSGIGEILVCSLKVGLAQSCADSTKLVVVRRWRPARYRLGIGTVVCGDGTDVAGGKLVGLGFAWTRLMAITWP